MFQFNVEVVNGKGNPRQSYVELNKVVHWENEGSIINF